MYLGTHNWRRGNKKSIAAAIRFLSLPFPAYLKIAHLIRARAQHIEWLKLNQIHDEQITMMQANTKNENPSILHSVANRSRKCWDQLCCCLYSNSLHINCVNRFGVEPFPFQIHIIIIITYVSIRNTSHYSSYLSFIFATFAWVCVCACEDFLHFVQHFKMLF